MTGTVMTTGLGLGLRRLGLERQGGRDGFSPMGLPGLALWLDAALSPATESGGAIVQLDDLSGNGRHASQATAARRPARSAVGGRVTILFDGVDDHLDATFSSLAIAQATWFAAYRYVTVPSGVSGGTARLAAAANAGADARNSGFVARADNFSGSAPLFDVHGNNLLFTVQIAKPVAGVSQIAIADWGPAASGGQLQDEAGTTATDASYSADLGPVTRFRLGADIINAAHDPGRYGNVHLITCGLYNRRLSAPERTSLRSWLLARIS